MRITTDKSAENKDYENKTKKKEEKIPKDDKELESKRETKKNNQDGRGWEVVSDVILSCRKPC